MASFKAKQAFSRRYTAAEKNVNYCSFLCVEIIELVVMK